MESPLDIFITLVVNDCEYEGTNKELVVNQVHPIFLKAHTEASKDDNPNWNKAMNGPFAYEYWKAVCNELETLEGMGAWYVLYHKYDMDII